MPNIYYTKNMQNLFYTKYTQNIQKECVNIKIVYDEGQHTMDETN